VTRNSPVVAHCSVDTLYFSILGEVVPGIYEVFRVCREEAEKAGAPVQAPWEFEGSQLMFRHHGWFSYAYWLSCDSFDVMVTKHDTLPALFVQVRQAYLYELGDPLASYRRVFDWLKVEFLSTVEEVTVSRLDLCADIIGFRGEELQAQLYTTRAREWKTRGEAGVVTGLEWGVRGNPVFVRLYDKVLEAYEHRKTWMDRLWLPHGWDPGERETVHDRNGEVRKNLDGSDRIRWKRRPERVMRLEFELRGEFLDRFAREGHIKALKRPEEALRNAGHLWEYLTGRWVQRKDRHEDFVGWLVLRQPTESANRTRWPPPAWWEQMARDGLHQAKMDKVVRRRQDDIDAELLLRQAAGCIAQRAAIKGDTTLIEAAQDFAREWARLLEDKNTTFLQVVKHKYDHRGIKRRPLEKSVQAGTKKDKEETP